jgi:hypothetical protein
MEITEKILRRCFTCVFNVLVFSSVFDEKLTSTTPAIVSNNINLEMVSFVYVLNMRT